MISAKIHYINSGNSQELNSEIINSSSGNDLTDHFALASKYYAEACNCMARGDVQQANVNLAIAMDYAITASDENEDDLE